MKAIIICHILLLLPALAWPQPKYMTRTGHISFLSEASLENIEAHNYQTSAIIDLSDGKIAFIVMIKAFEFKNGLMQEHFNDNYLESHKFPKATFTGQIVDVEHLDLEEGLREVKIVGMLTIKGITKEIVTTARLSKTDSTITAKATIPVALKDHEIKIPKLVFGKIAETVIVSIDINLLPYKR